MTFPAVSGGRIAGICAAVALCAVTRAHPQPMPQHTPSLTARHPRTQVEVRARWISQRPFPRRDEPLFHCHTIPNSKLSVTYSRSIKLLNTFFFFWSLEMQNMHTKGVVMLSWWPGGSVVPGRLAARMWNVPSHAQMRTRCLDLLVISLCYERERVKYYFDYTVRLNVSTKYIGIVLFFLNVAHCWLKPHYYDETVPNLLGNLFAIRSYQIDVRILQ